VGRAPQRSSSKQTTLLLAKPTTIAIGAAHGPLVAARMMRRPSPSAWIRIRAICKYALGSTLSFRSSFTHLYPLLSRRTCFRSNPLLRHVSPLISRPEITILTPKSSSLEQLVNTSTLIVPRVRILTIIAESLPAGFERTLETLSHRLRFFV